MFLWVNLDVIIVFSQSCKLPTNLELTKSMVFSWSRVIK